MNPSELRFREIAPVSPISIGWRHDKLFSGDIRSTVVNYLEPEDESSRCFSLARDVTIAPFNIATRTFAWESLCDWDDDTIESIGTLTDFCDRLELDLLQHGWRLPSEDELEVACGGSLFAWGDEIPIGTPYGNETDFTKHQEMNSNGLYLNANTYNVEVSRMALKLGDGGVAVCGGYEWPIPWLSFCPAFFVPACLLVGCLTEYLENAQIRPVMIA